MVPTFQLLMIMPAIFSCPANLRPIPIARKRSPCFNLIACSCRQSALNCVARSWGHVCPSTKLSNNYKSRSQCTLIPHLRRDAKTQAICEKFWRVEPHLEQKAMLWQEGCRMVKGLVQLLDQTVLWRLGSPVGVTNCVDRISLLGAYMVLQHASPKAR